jgi:hypothetical protein
VQYFHIIERWPVRAASSRAGRFRMCYHRERCGAADRRSIHAIMWNTRLVPTRRQEWRPCHGSLLWPEDGYLAIGCNSARLLVSNDEMTSFDTRTARTNQPYSKRGGRRGPERAYLTMARPCSGRYSDRLNRVVRQLCHPQSQYRPSAPEVAREAADGLAQAISAERSYR